MHTDLSAEVDLDLVVAEREVVADGVVALALRDVGGARLPAWSPGAHIDLVLEPQLVRQYSLCGEPSDPFRYRVAVLREPAGRGGSTFVHEQLNVSAPVKGRGPRNNFPLVASPRYLFVAGGVGITPLISMAAAADAAGAGWQLLYGGRTERSMAFRQELRGRYGDKVTVAPQDVAGQLDLEAWLGTPRPDTLVYCCGPEPLLLAVEDKCRRWPSGALHVERFAPKAQDEPVRPTSFEVELAVSGVTLVVPPGRTILEVVDAAGVQVISSCQEGTCGTCETSVLAGVVDHRDSLLTPQEQARNDTMMICVSRAASARLTLEL